MHREGAAEMRYRGKKNKGRIGVCILAIMVDAGSQALTRDKGPDPGVGKKVIC